MKKYNRLMFKVVFIAENDVIRTSPEEIVKEPENWVD